MAESLLTRLATLQERSPHWSSSLQRHLPLLKTAFENVTRPYPTSRQLYEQLDNPPIPARTFGRLLALLVDLEIIDLYTERSSANCYDIREYDAAALEDLEALLA